VSGPLASRIPMFAAPADVKEPNWRCRCQEQLRRPAPLPIPAFRSASPPPRSSSMVQLSLLLSHSSKVLVIAEIQVNRALSVWELSHETGVSGE
jgi:hypothetical protein